MNWKDLIFILVILLCPLMHFFMMRGMHKGDHQHEKDKKDDKTKSCH